MTRYVETAVADKASHARLVEGIQAIRRSTIYELWTDPDEEFPDDPLEIRWWEVWLRRRDGQERQRLTDFAEQHGLRTSEHYLGFADRTVVFVQASADQLVETFQALDDIAELRRPHEVSSLLSELSTVQQAEWVDDLADRLRAAPADAPVVCLLDTGAQNVHPLLTASLEQADVHVANPNWQREPVRPHGTEMAGLALYGDLQAALTTTGVVQLEHRLESVKFLPDQGSNDPDLYGAITARAVDRPEIEALDRSRVLLLAVTAPTSFPNPISPTTPSSGVGKPTAWSAAIDALAFGRAIDDTEARLTYLDRDEPRRPRLFVISPATSLTWLPATTIWPAAT